MVQFNLLPDVKLEHVKAQRTKRTVMLAAFSVTALSLFVFILLFLIVNVFQKQHIGNLNHDIENKTKELSSVQDLDKVLTVQNQLNALTGLHEKKPATSRLYNYLIQLTPGDAKISTVNLDFEDNTITITGSAGQLESINRFVDILKFTNYKEGENTKNAFSEVVLSSFGVGKSTSGGRTSYSLKFKFDPVIFDNTKSVELIVPNIISTRSITEKPSDLFETPQPTNTTGN